MSASEVIAVVVNDECYNCAVYDWEHPEDKSTLKKCTGCRFVTYCSQECQREHWEKVHKNHCKYLGQRKMLKNNMHIKEN